VARKIQGCDFKTVKGNDYETPEYVFKYLDSEFNFVFDLAASKDTAKCTRFYTPKDDALSKDWHKIKGYLWLNPPYSPLRPWLEKSYSEYLKGAKIVMLVPPFTYMSYFSRITPSEIRYIDKRIGFLLDGVPQNSNTHYSCLLIFDYARQTKISYISREMFK